MFGLTDKRSKIARLDPLSPAADSFRGLRNMLGSLVGTTEGKVFTVVSSASSEGKTTVAVHLAAACAQSGRKVLLIDGSLRQPALDRIFALANDKGLSSLLDDRADCLADMVQQAGMAQLSVLTAGPASVTSADALDTVRMAQLLAQAAADYDLVLIDTPALLSFADGAAIAKRSDGVLWVVHAGISRKVQALGTKKLLQQMNVPIIGCVLNRMAQAAR